MCRIIIDCVGGSGECVGPELNVSEVSLKFQNFLDTFKISEMTIEGDPYLISTYASLWRVVKLRTFSDDFSRI